MNPNIIDPLPAGGMTWGGKTHGPAINVGRVRPHILGPRILYVHLDELRDWVVKAGWHTEDDYQRRLAELEEKNDLLADADARITALEDENEAYERALRLKLTGETQNGDGESRGSDVQEGRAASVARSSAGAKNPARKNGSGKGRKVRPKGAQTS